MLTDPQEFLRFFDSIHRRTLRDIMALPPEAQNWTPPAEWLNRRIKMIDTDGALSGWRILMMLIEHEVHHRSQIDTYSGLNGWDVPQIYGRTREQIDELQEGQRARNSS